MEAGQTASILVLVALHFTGTGAAHDQAYSTMDCSSWYCVAMLIPIMRFMQGQPGFAQPFARQVHQAIKRPQLSSLCCSTWTLGSSTATPLLVSSLNNNGIIIVTPAGVRADHMTAAAEAWLILKGTSRDQTILQSKPKTYLINPLNLLLGDLNNHP